MKRFLLFSFVFYLTACSKDSGADEDNQSPVVLLTAPANGAAVAAGATISVSADVSDNRALRKVHLEIIHTNNGAFLVHEHYTPDGARFALSKSFTAQAGAVYDIKVEAEDRSGNIGRSKVTIRSN